MEKFTTEQIRELKDLGADYCDESFGCIEWEFTSLQWMIGEKSASAIYTYRAYDSDGDLGTAQKSRRFTTFEELVDIIQNRHDHFSET